MKQIQFTLVAFVALLAFTACEPNKPAVPTSFPKKHLIEEFTGQTCGYCPMGMDYIHSFVNQDTSFITILHHYGYSPDHFSVSGSAKITSALGVKGAPNMAIDRTPVTLRNPSGASQTALVFHPGNLEYLSRDQLETTTYASIVLTNSYEPDTRQLTVRVKGQVLKDEVSNLKLTVLVKESGMIDTQADYYNTFEGWQEFRHVNAVREFLSDPNGDALTVSNGQYNDVFSLQLKNDWKPENCMVVAFLSEDFKPVVQAAQSPVVSGSKGGADIVHGGITPVPVPDYYPEVNATSGPRDYSSNEAESLAVSYAMYEDYPSYGFRYWQLQAYSPNANIMVNRTGSVPFAEIYLFTDINDPTDNIPTGTYPLALTLEPGTVWAGYRDDEHFEVGGSQFLFTNKAYLAQGYLQPVASWLIADGTMTITESGWTLSGHARNGAPIELRGTTPIQNGGKASSAPKRQKISFVGKEGFNPPAFPLEYAPVPLP